MEFITKEINVAAGQQGNVSDLLDQVTGITYNNLETATTILKQQYEILKNITKEYMFLDSAVKTIMSEADEEIKCQIEQQISNFEIEQKTKQFCTLLKSNIFKFINHVLDNKEILVDKVLSKLFLEQFYPGITLSTFLSEYKQNETIATILSDLDMNTKEIQNFIKNIGSKTLLQTLHHHEKFIPFQTFSSFDMLFMTQLLTIDQRQKIETIVENILVNYMNFFNLFIQPLLDMEQLEPIISNMLDQIGLAAPNSKEAIEKMKQSLGLLKNNFPKYYKNMSVSRGGAAIFMADFLSDVHKQVVDDVIKQRQESQNPKHKKSGAKLISQFAALSKVIQENIINKKYNQRENQELSNLVDVIQNKIQTLVDKYDSDSDTDE